MQNFAVLSGCSSVQLMTDKAPELSVFLHIHVPGHAAPHFHVQAES